MLRCFKADLHIHTCLSPCGDLKMSPRNIVSEAADKGIAIIGICDHNSAENIPAVRRAAERKNVVVLPGMEVCTREEIHVLALFENEETAFEMQSLVYEHLHGRNDPKAFGMQVVANEFDEVERFEDKLLIGASDLSVEEIVGRIHDLDGLAIASHIDRESYSIIGQLGFIPKTLRFDALEISAATSDEEVERRFANYWQYTMIRNSDAHFLSDVGDNATHYLLRDPTFSEIAMALRKEGGRSLA